MWMLIASAGWGVSQIPPNQKLALRIVRYDISTHMEAVCEKVGCCDKSIRSHIGLENLQFCVVSLVTLQIGTFEHLATQNTMLQNPYFFCLFSSKRLYISQLCQQYIVIAYLFNNWVFLQHIFAKPHEQSHGKLEVKCGTDCRNIFSFIYTISGVQSLIQVLILVHHQNKYEALVF